MTYIAADRWSHEFMLVFLGITTFLAIISIAFRKRNDVLTPVFARAWMVASSAMILFLLVNLFELKLDESAAAELQTRYQEMQLTSPTTIEEAVRQNNLLGKSELVLWQPGERVKAYTIPLAWAVVVSMDDQCDGNIKSLQLHLLNYQKATDWQIVNTLDLGAVDFSTLPENTYVWENEHLHVVITFYDDNDCWDEFYDVQATYR